jgi:protein-S-isoprenylcysteine O-methyltransferase Ste14
VRSWTLGDWDARVLVGPDLVMFVGASALAAVRASRVAAVVAGAWTTAVTLVLTGYGVAERAAGLGVVFMVLATVGTLTAALTLWFGTLPVRWFFIGPFAFREAVPATPGRQLRRSLTQLVVFWTSFLIILPVILGWGERRLRLTWSVMHRHGWVWAGIIVFFGASAFGLWSCLSMALRGDGTPLPAATARRLVVVGPYRIVRNPMAVAGALQTIGVGLWLGSWMVIVSAFAGALLWNVMIRPEEEADLLARFGADYVAYADVVRCWVPVHRAARAT